MFKLCINPNPQVYHNGFISTAVLRVYAQYPMHIIHRFMVQFVGVFLSHLLVQCQVVSMPLLIDSQSSLQICRNMAIYQL